MKTEKAIRKEMSFLISQEIETKRFMRKALKEGSTTMRHELDITRLKIVQRIKMLEWVLA